MKYIFLLSGDYIDLAKEEIINLFDIENCRLLNNLLIIEVKNINEKELKELSQRLALTKRIYKFLFKCKINDLIKTIKKYDWNSIYKENFCLRIHYLNNNKNNDIKKIPIKNKNIKKLSNASERITRSQLTEKDLAKYIWHSVTNPKVNLESPKTKIELFFVNSKVHCGLLIYENKENFESRKSHLRPFSSPSSLHPKLARALVNITGIKENEILLDPFCGTGGFLIEAGLINIKTIGYDINKLMIKGCIKNLKHYKINNYKIKNQNALNINDKFNYVVTDLPYGLNSNVLLRYKKIGKNID